MGVTRKMNDEGKGPYARGMQNSASTLLEEMMMKRCGRGKAVVETEETAQVEVAE